VLDGFTRGEAARQVRGMTTLRLRLIDVDDCRTKAAIYGLNQLGRRPYELEEAWIVQSLVRDDGLSQLEVAELLGRHESWVWRRLALLEKRCAEVRQDREVGLLTPTAAREIARLPAGNQSEVLDVSRREALSSDELGGVVRLLLGAMTAEQKLFVLAKLREALGQAGAPEREGWDPRLSAGGNRVSKRLASLADRLAWAENFLECRGWTSLVASDRVVLGPVFARLSRDAGRVAEGAGDLVDAVKAESVHAVAHHSGVRRELVWKWRKALGAPTWNEGSRRLHSLTQPERWDPKLLEGARKKSRSRKARANMSATRKARAQSPNLRDAAIEAAQRPNSGSFKRKMSRRMKREWAQGVRHGDPPDRPSTNQEVLHIGTDTDEPTA
jgi:hypothetical protein